MVSLDDVIAVRSSLVDPTEDRYRDLPHIAPDTIERDTGRLFPYKTIGESGVQSGKYQFEAGDVLYSKIRPNLNKAILVDFEGLCSADMYALKVDPTQMTAAFLHHLLRSPLFVGYATNLSSRANIPKVNRDQLLSFQFDLPPLDEQRRIAAILDRAGRLRALQAGAAKLSDEVALSQFERLRTASVCQTMKLSDAYSFQEGPGVRKWQFTSAGVKLLNVGNIVTGGRLDLTKTDRYLSCDEAYGKYKHFLADAGDLVIASSGITFGIDGLLSTRAAFVGAEHLPLCMNTSTIRFKADPDLSDLTFLRSWFGSYEFRSQITRLVTGSAQQNFGPSHLRQLSITLPDMRIQRAFARQVRCFEDVRGRQVNALAHLDELFGSLQHRAFSGQL
jgi:type I restriction enzyme S subunit